MLNVPIYLNKTSAQYLQNFETHFLQFLLDINILMLWIGLFFETKQIHVNFTFWILQIFWKKSWRCLSLWGRQEWYKAFEVVPPTYWRWREILKKKKSWICCSKKRNWICSCKERIVKNRSKILILLFKGTEIQSYFVQRIR